MTDTRPYTAANPVAPTARWMAAARARESERPDALFEDPLAAALAGPDGFAGLERMEFASLSAGPGLYGVIRTRFFDDFLLGACEASDARQVVGQGVRQVVLAAAGMDTRAFRLGWPSHTRLYEMDLAEVLDVKENEISAVGARATCQRHSVRADLKLENWPEALLAAGYKVEEPSVWLIEGLLLYLPNAAVQSLLEKVAALSAPGSLLGLDVMNRDFLFSPAAWPQLAILAGRGAPGRFGTNDPEALLESHGWRARVTQPGEEGADFGRWTNPPLSRWVAGLPRAFLMRGQRLVESAKT